MPTSRTTSSLVHQSSLSRQTKSINTSKPVQEGRPRIRSHLSVQDDNVNPRGERRSKSSTSSQDAKSQAMSGLKETNSSQGARKTTRVFRNSRTKEEAAMGRKLVNSACLQVPRADATFLVHAKDEDTDLRQIEETNQKRKVERELPADVLNINIAEGLYEYCQDVHSYLRQMEEVLSISPDYLDKDQVTGHMRSVLVNWLTEVQHHLKVSVETLYRTVHTLDLVLSLRSVEPNMLQLVGITCMLLASKLEEYYPVEISKLLHLTEDSYKPKEVVNMERIILKLIDFKVIFILVIESSLNFSLSVHHAIPSGIPAYVHPGGLEICRDGVLLQLHLPAGLSPGGDDPLLPPSLPSSGRGSPGCSHSLQGGREGLHCQPSPLHHLDSHSGLLHLIQGRGHSPHGIGITEPTGIPGFR